MWWIGYILTSFFVFFAIILVAYLFDRLWHWHMQHQPLVRMCEGLKASMEKATKETNDTLYFEMPIQDEAMFDRYADPAKTDEWFSDMAKQDDNFLENVEKAIKSNASMKKFVLKELDMILDHDDSMTGFVGNYIRKVYVPFFENVCALSYHLKVVYVSDDIHFIRNRYWDENYVSKLRREMGK